MSSLPQILVFLAIAVIFIAGLLLGRFTAPTRTYLLVSFVCLFVCFIVGGVGGRWQGVLTVEYSLLSLQHRLLRMKYGRFVSEVRLQR